MAYGIGYAGAESDYDSADVVIYGIPYDHTSCFKAGAREAPTAVRRASYNFEEIHFEHGLDQPELQVCDYGNCDDYVLPEDMFEEVDFCMGPAIRDGKFTIAIGGEHTVNIPIVRNFRKDDIALISIDAHLDSRDEYLGTPNSHACITRRAADHLGLNNVFVLGCRAIAREELDRDDPVPFISSYEIMDKGIDWAIKKALESVKNERIYLTVDIDGIDPAFAPGTGTPEPFGLMPYDVKKVINAVGDRLAGFDVVEVCPPADPAGITSILAARYINEVMVVHAKNLRN
ncbi:MAG: agmatinase [Candidatus Methanomethylophilaceae archaeon]|nr:agmatinase [Candidatus Methanomethylophilaceae archaeon]